MIAHKYGIPYLLCDIGNKNQICLDCNMQYEMLPNSFVLEKGSYKSAGVKLSVVYITIRTNLFLFPSTILSSTIVISGVSSYLPPQSNYIHRFFEENGN